MYRDVSEPSTAQLAPRVTAAPKRVPLAYWLHSLFGLKLSLFLGFVCLTGTIATVAHEIEWLYKPEVRASPVVGETQWGTMWDAAQRAHPDAKLTGIGTFDRSDSSYFAKAISAVGAQGRDFTIYTDPGTSRVTGYEYTMRALLIVKYIWMGWSAWLCH